MFIKVNLFIAFLFYIHLVCGLPVDTENQLELQFQNDLNNFSPVMSMDEIALYDVLDRPTYYAVDPEAYMEVNQIIRYHGYPVEEYKVETEDGYELTIQRIPYGKNGPTDHPRKPVLVQHGLLCSSASWISNTPDKNLPYVLADKGYDVWLGNIRGTLFGDKHKYYSQKSKEFWAYSFDQMAKYDVPAVIDKMLSVTGYQQILYIGHSMGTTMAFAMLSSQPKYNKIVKGMVALAPVARLTHVRSPIRILAPFSNQVGWILNIFGNGKFKLNDAILKLLSTTVCNSPLKIMCESVLFMLCGFSHDQLNSTRLPTFLHHTPAATSVQNLVHFSQVVSAEKFQHYDYGYKENLIKYKRTTPPEYDVKKITAPVALFWSDNDYLADPNDVSWLASQLPSLVIKHRVPYDTFSHLDFIWAIDINRLLHDKLLNVLSKLWKN